MSDVSPSETCLCCSTMAGCRLATRSPVAAPCCVQFILLCFGVLRLAQNLCVFAWVVFSCTECQGVRLFDFILVFLTSLCAVFFLWTLGGAREPAYERHWGFGTARTCATKRCVYSFRAWCLDVWRAPSPPAKLRARTHTHTHTHTVHTPSHQN